MGKKTKLVFVDPFLECALRYQKDNSPARIYGEVLWFKGHTINLGAKRQVLEIVKTLFEAQSQPITLIQLISRLGEIKDIESCSDRLVKTYRQKILKSIQRARHFLTKNFRKFGIKEDWFPYDHKLGTWKLYGRSTKKRIGRKQHRDRRANISRTKGKCS